MFRFRQRVGIVAERVGFFGDRRLPSISILWRRWTWRSIRVGGGSNENFERRAADGSVVKEERNGVEAGLVRRVFRFADAVLKSEGGKRIFHQNVLPHSPSAWFALWTVRWLTPSVRRRPRLPHRRWRIVFCRLVRIPIRYPPLLPSGLWHVPKGLPECGTAILKIFVFNFVDWEC